MSTLRIMCIEQDTGAACHVGGTVEIKHRTWDVPCPPELAEWIEKYQEDCAKHDASQKPGPYYFRGFTGVEYIA